MWSYIGKKQRRVTPEDGSEKGDAYTFIGLDRINKAIIGHPDGVGLDRAAILSTS